MIDSSTPKQYIIKRLYTYSHLNFVLLKEGVSGIRQKSGGGEKAVRNAKNQLAHSSARS